MYRSLTTVACIIGLVSTGHAQMCKYKLPNGDTKIVTDGRPVPRGAKRISCYGSMAAKKNTRKKKRRTKSRSESSAAREAETPRDSWSPVKRPSKLQRLRKARPTTSKAARERAQRYEGFVKNAAEVYSLPEALIWAVMHTESHFDPTVVSNKGAHGLMQLLPETAKSMGVRDIFDPEENIMGGARYLRVLANRFEGDLYKVIAGYNAGPGAVAAANGIPFKQTGEYVRRVMNAYYTFEAQPPTKAP